MQRATRSLRRMLAQAAPARGVAPHTQPAGSAAAAATGGGATKEISPEMQKYLATEPYMFGEKDWARDEAEERIRRRIQGLPVEFGKNYAALRALEEAGYDVAADRGDEE